MYRLINGKIDLLPKTDSVSWNSDAGTFGTQLNFESTVGLADGAVISLYNDTKELFRGVIIKKTQNRWTWSYTCQDYSFYLKNKVIKQFNGMPASQAINSLLDEAYITGSIVSIPTKITQIYKNKARTDIIDDILDQAQKDQGINYFKEIEGVILYVRKLEDMKINPKVIMPKGISIDYSIENLKNKIQIVSNGESNNSIVATAEDTSTQWWYGLLTDMQEVDDKDLSQAQNTANNALKTSNVITCTSSFDLVVIEGADDIKANRMIYLNAGSRLNGYYKLKGAAHTLEKGLHKVNISIEWTVVP